MSLPYFRITTNVTATVEETWLVQASSADEARAFFEDNDPDVTKIHVKDEVIGDEVDRVVMFVHDATPEELDHHGFAP